MTYNKHQKNSESGSQDATVSQTVEDFKTASFIVSIAFNVAMLCLWLALQVVLTT